VKTIIVKYGGAAMEDLALCKQVAGEIAKLSKSNRVIVVHGGGKEVSALQNRLGLETKFIDGIRYTDEKSLEVAEMLLSGTINKRIVSLLQLHGVSAIGISGRDGRMAKMKRVLEAGFVGEVQSVATKVVDLLLSGGFIPVVSPISEEESGQPLNVNADEMARAIAEAFKADALVYLSDVDGLMLGGKVVSKLLATQIGDLLDSPEVTGGMIPKLKSSLSAVEMGVGKVIFLNGNNLESLQDVVSDDISSGTTISVN